MSLLSNAAEVFRAKLLRRRDAYRAVFNPSGELAPMAEVVMRDLAFYCHASRTGFKVSPVTGTADPIALAFAEGRRDVFNRIVAQLNMDVAQVNSIAYQRDEL